MSILQHAMKQIEELRLMIVDYRLRCISSQALVKSISTEERIQNFRDTQRMIEEAVLLAQVQIMRHGSIDWKCAEFAQYRVGEPIDNISATPPHQNEPSPCVEADNHASITGSLRDEQSPQLHHYVSPDNNESAQHQNQDLPESTQHQNEDSTQHQNEECPEVEEDKHVSTTCAHRDEPSPQVHHHVSPHIHDTSQHFPSSNEKVLSWLKTSPEAQGVLPHLASLDPLGPGGFFHALAEGINVYLADAGLLPRNATQLTPQKLSGALGAYLAFHLCGNTRAADCTDDKITVRTIQNETLMGLSWKPVSGSLINILQQSDESVAIYGPQIARGKLVCLHYNHVHNLAHMTGCEVIIRDTSGHVIYEGKPRNPDDDNPVITVTIDCVAGAPITPDEAYTPDRPSTRQPPQTILHTILDGLIPIYNIGDSKVHAQYLFSAHVARLHTKR
jgi:hypothetical protein